MVPKSSHYTPGGGIDALRQVIAENSRRRRGVAHKTDEILVSVGAKHTLFNLAMALFDPGGEIYAHLVYEGFQQHSMLELAPV